MKLVVRDNIFREITTMLPPKSSFSNFFSRLFSLILSVILLFGSCRKIDHIVERETPSVTPEGRFFTDHAPKDTTVKAALAFVKRENEQHRFVSKIINRMGYPYWDKAIVKRPNSFNGRSYSDSSTTVFIPFVMDSAMIVNSTLIVVANPSDTNFLLLADWQYAEQTYGSPEVDSTAESMSLLFMMQNKSVFGYDRFTFTDPNLFGLMSSPPGFQGREIKIGDPNLNGRTMLEYEVEVCFNTYSCPYPSECAQLGGCDYLTGCTSNHAPYCQLIVSLCWYYTYNVNEGQWSTGGGGGPEGGQYGGSGAGWNSWDPPICEEEPQGRSLTYQDCGPGWNPPGIIVPIEAPIINNDSLIAERLKRLITKAGNKPDSLHNLAQQDGNERTFTFERVNGDTIITWIKTGGTHKSSPNLNNTSLAIFHTHQEDDFVGGSDKNQCFDGPDIYKLYKNGPIDKYPVDASIISTRDYFYAAVVVDTALFKSYIRTLCGTTSIKDIEIILNDKHIDAMDLCTTSGCNWQKKTEKGVLAITANNNASVSGIKIFRSPRQNINFTLLTP